jgi:hypothetical protein
LLAAARALGSRGGHFPPVARRAAATPPAGSVDFDRGNLSCPTDFELGPAAEAGILKQALPDAHQRSSTASTEHIDVLIQIKEKSRPPTRRWD